jgi:hypothetical protein
MRILKFQQPCDYRFGGRLVSINAEEVAAVMQGESIGEVVIKMKDGRGLVVAGDYCQIVDLIAGC